LALAAGLIALGGFAVRHNWRAALGEYQGLTAMRVAEQPGAQLAAMDRLRGALRTDPSNPDNVIRLGTLLLQMENQKARAGDLGGFDRGRLTEALAMMNGVRRATILPSNVERKMSEVATMLCSVYLRTGDVEKANQYADETVLHSVEYLRLQGRVLHGMEVFYRTLIRRAAQVERFDLVVSAQDRFERDDHTRAGREAEDLEIVNRSRLRLGESPQMMASVTEQLLNKPKDPRLLGELIRAGLQHGEAANALLVMELLEQRGVLAPGLDDYRRQLQQKISN
jgi:hypothetical protein